MPDPWVTPPDELYVIEKLWPNAKALATSVSEQDGKTYPVAWTNQYGKARVFGTTFGHSDDTFRDPGAHRGRIDTRADVNQRNAADAGARAVLESEHGLPLHRG